MDKIAAAFAEAIQGKVFSGAQVLFGRGERTLYQGAFGRVSEDPESRAITDDSLFDIASLTKPVATVSLAMLAVAEGRLELDAPLTRDLPEWRGDVALTPRHLLQHTSGLPAWLPLYEAARLKGWSYERVRDSYLEQIAAAEPVAPLGAKRLYSDLGFLLLGFLLERIFGRRLAGLFADRVAAPLQMSQTLFHPLRHPELVVPQDIAATEVCPWRGKLLLGEVHDDNAHVLGGVAGHAGLFASARDLGRFAREILAAKRGGGSLFSRDLIEEFLGRPVLPKLGWDRVSPEGSQAGRHFSVEDSVGHLAFTGCSLWIDFSDAKYLLLLTNRVHPRRDNEAIKAFRPRIHDLLLETPFPG